MYVLLEGGVRMYRASLTGEINKAPGNVPEAFACAEPILFTTDARILHRIEQHDAAGMPIELRHEVYINSIKVRLPASLKFRRACG